MTACVVVASLNENGASGDIPLNQKPTWSSYRNLINFIKLLNQCDTEKKTSDLFNSANGPAFGQIISSSDWDPNEHITMKNK